MADLVGLAADPTAWVALVTLIIMEVVLGIDNLVFVSILSNRVAPEQRQAAQRVGLGSGLDQHQKAMTAARARAEA